MPTTEEWLENYNRSVKRIQKSGEYIGKLELLQYMHKEADQEGDIVIRSTIKAFLFTIGATIMYEHSRENDV